MNHSVPSTSKAAYKQAQQGLIDSHHAKIVSALERIGTGNYEIIAAYVGLDKHAVGRRLKELEADSKVYKPGTQSPTKTGRMANNYSLCTSGFKTDSAVKESNPYKKGVKTAADFASDLIRSTQQSTLFP